MNTLIIAVLLVAAVLGGNIRNRVHYEYAFESFIRDFAKSYATSDEYVYRLQVFADNLDQIEIHNSVPSTYKLGVNQFTDMTQEEFSSSRFVNGYHSSLANYASNFVSKKDFVAPESVDWTTKGAVTAVKDQAQCGSCWAFSATGGLEGVYFIKNNVLKTFSEQQLVDCSSSYGNKGCNGGLMASAYGYVKDHGLCVEGDYPYHAKDESCKTTCTSAVSISSFVSIKGSEPKLAEAVAEQPVPVAINASPLSSYKSGIFTGFCLPQLNHGVLAVGYGVENGKKYWKVKNSWGSSWGESGYFRLEKDILVAWGQCGIAQDAVYPVI